MSSREGQDLSYKAGEATSRAQMKKEEYKEMASEAAGQTQMMKKDEYADKASEASQSAKESTTSTVGAAQNYAYELKDQAPVLLKQASLSNIFQGEQVKSMAQGAAEAVKNTLGMNDISSDNRNNGTAAASATNPPTKSSALPGQ